MQENVNGGRHAVAFARVAQVVAAHDDARMILNESCRVIGEHLAVDRVLIYRVSLEQEWVNGLEEWVSPQQPVIPASIGCFPLARFQAVADVLLQSRSPVVSHHYAVHPLLVVDGAAEMLHGEMGIKSLLWHPFGYAEQGFHLLVLNTVEQPRRWARSELDFIASVSHLVSLALHKIELLERQQHQLEALVAERTAALSHTLSELSTSNAELVEFAQAISHDLQEPVRTMTGFAELLQERVAERLDARARDHLRHIREGGLRMQAMIRDLLTYARLGREGMALHPICLGSLMGQTIDDLDNLCNTAGATIEFDPLPVIRGDPAQLRRMFENLLTNAIKYRAQERELRVEVRVEAHPDGWLFRFCDNGIGFDQRHAERAFALFRRLNNTRGVGGTGMGLAICKKVVEYHGGRIWIETARGVGTTVLFTLPCDPGYSE